MHVVNQGNVIWTKTITEGNTTGFSLNLPSIHVFQGQSIDFVISRGPSNNDCDSTVFNPTITLTTPDAPPANGSVLISRVNSSGALLFSPATKANVDASVVSSSAKTPNPASWAGVNAGGHGAHASDLSGYTETVGTCTYPIGGSECSVTNFSTPGSCSSGDCNTGITVQSNTVTKVVYKYTGVSVPPPVGGPTFKASTGFSATQGGTISNPWVYEQSTPFSAFGTVSNPMTYYASHTECGEPCWRGSEPYALIKQYNQHPGNTKDSVRRWVAPSGGNIAISGFVRRVGNACGDGVSISIYGAGFFWSTDILQTDTSTKTFPSNLNGPVTMGDSISFRVNKKGANNYCDDVLLDATISYSSSIQTGGSIQVKKLFLGVSPHSQSAVSLDGGPFTDSPTYTDAVVGTHALSIQIPPNMKMFYAVCPNSSEDYCLGPIKGGFLGPQTVTSESFSHALGVSDKITLFYGSPSMAYTSDTLALTFNNTRSFFEKLGELVKPSYAYALTSVPVMGVWGNTRAADPSVAVASCSQKFFVTDDQGDQGQADGPGDLYSEVGVALGDWHRQVKPFLLFGGTFKPAGGSTVNGITSYPILQLSEGPNPRPDGKSTIGYSNQDYFVATETIGLARRQWFDTPEINYILETDIALDPTASFSKAGIVPEGSYHLPTVLLHEIGHALGLGEFDEAPLGTSVMTTPEYKKNIVASITANDTFTINNLYKSCQKQPANVTMSMKPNPTPWKSLNGGQPLCDPISGETLRPNGEWPLNITLKETTGGTGVTFKSPFTVRLYKSGILMKTLSDRMFWGGESPRVEAGGSKYVPFRVRPGKSFVPDRAELTFFGTDDLGNSIQTTGSVDLNQTGASKLKTCKSGDDDFFGLGVSGTFDSAPPQ